MTTWSCAPSDVLKSSSSTKVRGDWRMIVITRRVCAAISGAPPAPGRRTFGSSYEPMTVELRLPWRSIWAAPRNPTSIRPPCNQ